MKTAEHPPLLKLRDVTLHRPLGLKAEPRAVCGVDVREIKISAPRPDPRARTAAALTVVLEKTIDAAALHIDRPVDFSLITPKKYPACKTKIGCRLGSIGILLACVQTLGF